MEKTTVLNSLELKKRFVKDNNLPITVFHNPYFTERLEAIDWLFGCIKKWELFCDELANFANEQDYFAHYNAVKDAAIDHIKESESFNIFTNENWFVNKNKGEYPKHNIYSLENCYKPFISIDMKKANFTALSTYRPEIFDNANTWEQFIGQYTELKHIANSKYIRQVIMGACNPKRQIQLIEYYMNTLLSWIKNQVPGVEVFSMTVDEIILCHPYADENNSNMHQQLADIKSAIARHAYGKMVRMEEFYLEPLADYGYERINLYDTNDITFKCVDAEQFHQHAKIYKGQEITENDLVFYHNGILARFLEPIPNYLNPIASS